MTTRTFDELKEAVRQATTSNDADALLRYATELDVLVTPQAEALVSSSRGEALFLRGDHAEALRHFHRALTLHEKLGDRNGVADAAGSIGNVHRATGEYSAALSHYNSAAAIYEELGDRSGVARVASNIGIVHYNKGEYPAALSHFHHSLALHEELGDRKGIAIVTGNISTVHHSTGDYPEALSHSHRSLALHEEHGDRKGVAGVTCNIGNVYRSTGDYPAALSYFHRALALSEEISYGPYTANIIANIGGVHSSSGNSTEALSYFHRALAFHEELGDTRGVAIDYFHIGSVHATKDDYPAALSYFHRALALYEKIGDRSGVARTTAIILIVCVAQGSDAEAQDLLATMDGMHIDEPDTYIQREILRATLQERSGDLDGAAKTLQPALSKALGHGLRAHTAQVHKALRDLAQKRNDFAGYIEHNNEFTRITEEINGKDTATKLAMQEKQREIDAREKEHAKHMAVLHSTLPKHVAERVARGEVVNDHFDNASVIFLDIVGFTELSSSMSSQDVITLLDSIFTQCDAICEQHNVTKIKTIGDSYMCVSFDNVVNAALCALDFSHIRVAHQRRASASHEVSDVSHEVDFRIGIHCGPVTAGVIGTQRMQYDVWGDTVNVASRMESTSEAGRVHVSEAFASNLKSSQESIIKDPISESHEVSHASVARPSVAQSELVTRHSSLVTIERGSMDIKGKGMMKTYWLENNA